MSFEPIVDPFSIPCKFHEFIGIWDRFVSPQLCDEIIELFERGLTTDSIVFGEGSQQFEQGRGKLERNDLAMMLQDTSPDLTKHVHQYIQTCFLRYMNEYQQLTPVKMMSHIVKVQKTEPTGGYHTWHYENSSYYVSSRELTWMVYLNDVPDGEGETEFMYQKLRVPPKKGTILIWPAGLTHVHRGLTMYSTNKYIATGWYNKIP